VPSSTVAEPVPGFGDECLELALKLDEAMREKAPAGWKGDQAKEAHVLNAIYPILKKDKGATMAIFEIIKTAAGATRMAEVITLGEVEIHITRRERQARSSDSASPRGRRAAAISVAPRGRDRRLPARMPSRKSCLDPPAATGAQYPSAGISTPVRHP